MEPEGSRKGWIFDIKRFAVHDGPGLRTTVFLKGCVLSCIWCHNPESIAFKPQLLLHPERCIGCGACVEACPNNAHSLNGNGEHLFLRERCDQCGACVQECFPEALLMAGRQVCAAEVVEALQADRAFYESSKGGITLSGGEPFLQGDFTLSLLRCCKDEGFHTAVDTSGHVSWNVIEKALPYVDLILYDLKHMDPREHARLTGSANDLILANLMRLEKSGVPIEIRFPVIPTVNDGAENIESLGRFLASVGAVKTVRLLSYHSFAGSKYAGVGRPNTMPAVDSPTKEHLDDIAAKIQRQVSFPVIASE